MTNTQFYVGIAIPCVLILLGWLHQNTRLSDMRSDFKELRGDMTQLRGEMTQLRVDINRDMVTLRDSIHRDMVPLHERMAAVEAKNA